MQMLVHLIWSQKSIKLSILFILYSASQQWFLSLFQLTDSFFCLILLLILSSVLFVSVIIFFNSFLSFLILC